MKIEHVAIWTDKLEDLKEFYSRYFDGAAGEQYHNPTKGFTSYFITFASGARLELMHRDGMVQRDKNPAQFFSGYAHLAFSLGDKAAVDAKTAELSEAGFSPLDGPRTTGDGYYEATFQDPDGNLIEITE